MTSQDPLVEVEIAPGTVRGSWRGEPFSAGASAAFRGIPYAEPPVGALRFAAPVPAAPWAGVRDCLEHGPTPQRGDPGVTLIPEPSVPGEGTLTLSVVTPSPRTPQTGPGLPVLVWLHGGGYVAGSPASPWYDGRAFARDGVVVVTPSYRLGMDGFGWIEDAPSNRGVRDWLLALEWVRENIVAFGGDPGRVTIAGQSAGGGAVQTLLGMEAAQHLFHRVLSLSGATADIPAERSEEFGRRLAERLGVSPTRAGLGALDEEQVLAAQEKEAGLDSLKAMARMLEEGLPLGPTLDDELILRPTDESLAAGVGADKPLLLGTTDDEFTMAFADAPRLLRLLPTRVLLRRLGMPKDAMAPYLAANTEVTRLGALRTAGRFLTDRMFRASLLRTVAARHAGAAAVSGDGASADGASADGAGAAPTWVYRFAWPSGRFGFAEHCLDVPFFFDCLDSPEGIEALAGPHPPQELADRVHGAAVAFIRGESPGWEPYVEPGRTTYVHDLPPRLVADGYRSARALV